MRNVSMEVKDSMLLITIDLSKNYGPSKSKKTTIIATSGGNVSVPETDGVKLGLNVYK